MGPRADLDRCLTYSNKIEVKQSLFRPNTGFQEVEAPRLQENHIKVVRLSSLRTGRLYPLGDIPGIHFCWRMSRPQGHSAVKKIV